MIPTLKRPNVALFVFVFAAFIKPVGLVHPLFDKLYLVWKLLVVMYLAVTLLPKLIKPIPVKKTPGLWGLSLFWVIYLVNCIRVGEDVMTVAMGAIASLLVMLLIFYETEQGNGLLLLDALAGLFAFLIVAHIVSVLLIISGVVSGGSGSMPVYLFGMDNYSAFFIYPMLSVVLYRNAVRYSKFGLSGWLLLLLVVAIYTITKSMTAVGAGMIFLLICLIKNSWPKLPRVRGIGWLIVAMVVFLVLVCGFQFQNLLASILDAMSKGVTLNSRTIIWADALELIKQRPFLGHGAFTQKQLFEDYVLYGTTHAHNLLLELLVRAGIVGTVAYLCFLLGFVSNGRKKLPQAHGVLLAGLVAQLVLFFMDYYPTITTFYIFMGLLYKSDSFSAVENARKSCEIPEREETV